MQIYWGLSELCPIWALLIYIPISMYKFLYIFPESVIFSFWKKNVLTYSVSPSFSCNHPFFQPIPSHPLNFLSLFCLAQLLLRVGPALPCGPPNWLSPSIYQMPIALQLMVKSTASFVCISCFILVLGGYVVHTMTCFPFQFSRQPLSILIWQFSMCCYKTVPCDPSCRSAQTHDPSLVT